jgi:membrane-bound metal-dependent hydrolase YbcI (DUF457 family)
MASHLIGVRRTVNGALRIDRLFFTQLNAQFPGSNSIRSRCTNSSTTGVPVYNIDNSPVPDEGGEMMARTHVLLGINALWLLQIVPSAVTPENIALLAAACTFGALLPDLDAVESKIKSLSVAGIRPFVPFAEAANRTWGHRGFLHSPLALLALAIVLTPLTLWAGWQTSAALWLGYATHILADAATRTGVPGVRLSNRWYLLPKPWRILTGSPAEDVLLPILASTALFLLLSKLSGLYS